MRRAQAEWADLLPDLSKPVLWWRHDPPDRHDLTIAGPAGPMVHVDFRTGRVEFGEGYDLDEAARLFWIGVGAQVPGLSAAGPALPRVLQWKYVRAPFVEGRRHGAGFVRRWRKLDGYRRAGRRATGLHAARRVH